ncbi:glycoside hydrolase family 15 protein [Cellulomonas endophytica]|uniref:glycoside hydrolase family 15 protein n=1 Tax=Cellulomonas endophytica TaxID=2494735 RepID=UPI00101030EC|nr:glycoside hydrolase family 15 protein [Cellulomonas endophytica]
MGSVTGGAPSSADGGYGAPGPRVADLRGDDPEGRDDRFAPDHDGDHDGTRHGDGVLEAAPGYGSHPPGGTGADGGRPAEGARDGGPDVVVGSGRAAAEALRPPTPRTDGYAALRSYAALGDGRTVALVADDGCIDWFPVPDLDSPPAFGALLDEVGGGTFSLAPTAPYRMRRRYLPGSNVLSTEYVTGTGSARVTEALTTGVAGRLPWCELARRVEGLTGDVPMGWRIAPGTALATASPWVQGTTHGPVLRIDGVTMATVLSSDLTPVVGEQEVAGVFTTTPGSRHLVALVGTEREPVQLPTPEEVDDRVSRTLTNWQVWTEAFRYQGPWPLAVQRSALTLKLLVHAPSGSVAAAATTSLPESWDGGKNWDYRYAWLRDTAYAVDALIAFGLREETHAAISWVVRTVRESEPRVFYALDGSVRDDHSEPDVPGWRGIGPVSAGNRAGLQRQLGVYGDVLAVVRGYVDAGNLLDADTGRALAALADEAADAWHRPDAGMWELDEEQHYTTSKLGCWQALECAAHLAEAGQLPGVPDRWRAEARRIRAWVEEHCWDEARGTYLMHPGSDALDASILLHAMSGFDRSGRMSSTVDVLRRELGTGPWLHRYTGMDREEGAFVACSFWGVAALAHLGRLDEARAWMDELLAESSDVGVWAEMVDPATGHFLGNLPQALSHLALVQAAVAVWDAEGRVPVPVPDVESRPGDGAR